ncbi:ATP-binding protein [Janthinobacterium psychrotolerans]|uniref:Virulence sensor protein BvgS n=1 Tax=Janthinobacterium psychrotolerans TaxID=1747903 RepID=A0A1A7BW62_9BURK|nr:ATP-binding protein [Janthinobacterium psychrotolerans]OBV37816.1 PAS domain S-box-containing protein [Janthinobacterium psychrotolerans]
MEWLGLAAALLMAGAALSLSHLAEQARQYHAERERLGVLSALMANNIEADLAATNAALAGIIHDYLAGPAAIGQGVELARRLDAIVAAMPGVRALAVLDKSGLATAASAPDVIGKNFSGRAYFQALLRTPDASALHVAAPYRSFRDDLVISVARMVTGAAGNFDGVVVATLDPAYFKAKFHTAMYASDVWGVLMHGDGRQILSYPLSGAVDGDDLDRPGSFFRRHRDSALPASILRGTLHDNGEARVMAINTVRPDALKMDRALMIGLSRSEAAIAAPLQRQAWTWLLASGLVTLASSALLYWLQRRRAYHAALQEKRDEERQALLAMTSSEARFRTLIEDAPLAIAILRGGYFLYSNPRYRALHGYAPHDDLGGLPWHSMIAPQSRASLAASAAMIDADSPDEQRFEALGLGKQGSLVPVFKTTARVLLADGPATLVFAQDISAQKHAEQEMRLAHDAAQAASLTKAQFLANMSHEIRSPLNAILGMAWLLERARLDAEAQDMVRKVRAAGQSLLSIVNDVLDMSKIEAGHMRIEQAPFRLADVLATVAAGMAVAANGKALELLIDAPPVGVVRLVGDALRLEQVLVNLTGNAVKFTAAGQVELRIAVADCENEQVRLRFCVRDSGIGIADDKREAIFSPFTQADDSTTRRFGGTGLGLTICRQLVQLMGGELSVDSQLGAGSAFSFTIPLRMLPEAPADLDVAPPAQSSGRALQDVCVLVVDDSDINREVAGHILQDQGAHAVFASDGRQALDWLCAHPAQADIVLMDVQMPVMDGIEATRRLRAMRQFETLPIIALTAGAFQEQRAVALRAGMNDFISKPFDVPLAIALIARLHRCHGGAAPAMAPPPAQNSPEAPQPAAAGAALDPVRGMAQWLDEAPYRHHLGRFGTSHADSASRMRQQLGAGDTGAMLALAHALSGIAANLALPGVARAARGVERLLLASRDQHAIDEVNGALDVLEQELARAQRAIAVHLAALPPAPQLAQEAPAPLAALLGQLLAVLDQDDPAPAEPLLGQLRAWLPGAQLEPVTTALSNFDFRAARAAVGILAARQLAHAEEHS